MSPVDPPPAPPARPAWERGREPEPCHNPECSGVIDPFGRRNEADGDVVQLGRCISRHPGGPSCDWRYARPFGGSWVREA